VRRSSASSGFLGPLRCLLQWRSFWKGKNFIQTGVLVDSVILLRLVFPISNRCIATTVPSSFEDDSFRPDCRLRGRYARLRFPD